MEACIARARATIADAGGRGLLRPPSDLLLFLARDCNSDVIVYELQRPVYEAWRRGDAVHLPDLVKLAWIKDGGARVEEPSLVVNWLLAFQLEACGSGALRVRLRPPGLAGLDCVVRVGRDGEPVITATLGGVPSRLTHAWISYFFMAPTGGVLHGVTRRGGVRMPFNMI